MNSVKLEHLLEYTFLYYIFTLLQEGRNVLCGNWKNIAAYNAGYTGQGFQALQYPIMLCKWQLPQFFFYNVRKRLD